MIKDTATTLSAWKRRVTNGMNEAIAQQMTLKWFRGFRSKINTLIVRWKLNLPYKKNNFNIFNKDWNRGKFMRGWGDEAGEADWGKKVQGRSGKGGRECTTRVAILGNGQIGNEITDIIRPPKKRQTHHGIAYVPECS